MSKPGHDRVAVGSGRVPTNVMLKPELWKDARKRALDDGTSGSEIVERALQMFLYPCERGELVLRRKA